MDLSLSKLAALWMPVAIYIFVTASSFGSPAASCEAGGQALSEQLCLGMSLNTDVSKTYFGLFELPVYFAGVNIDLANYGVIFYSTLLSVTTLKVVVNKKLHNGSRERERDL